MKPGRFMTPLWVFALFFTVGVSLLVSAAIPEREALVRTMLIAGSAMLAVGQVSWAVLLHRMWKAGGVSRPPPVVAVVLCFVPVLNLIWTPAALVMLTRATRTRAAEAGVEAPRPSAAIAVFAWIALLATAVPPYGLLVSPLAIALWILAHWALASAASRANQAEGERSVRIVAAGWASIAMTGVVWFLVRSLLIVPGYWVVQIAADMGKRLDPVILTLIRATRQLTGSWVSYSSRSSFPRVVFVDTVMVAIFVLVASRAASARSRKPARLALHAMFLVSVACVGVIAVEYGQVLIEWWHNRQR